MITEPVPTLLERVLLRAVRDHAAVEGRRRPSPTLHVGIPGSAVRTFAVDAEDRLDLALRVEMVEAMCRADLDRGRVPLVWLTRRDDGSDTEDHAWAAAIGQAGPELGVRLELVVITRRSWRDPRSGVGRRWTRLRKEAG